MSDNVVNLVMSGIAKYSGQVNEPYQYKLRASKLPFCPLTTVQDMMGKYSDEKSYSMDFYTGIGNAIHHLVQNYLPIVFPDNIIGNWKCNHILSSKEKDNVTITRRCGFKTEKFCSFAKVKLACPHGNKNCKLDYQEIEFDYKGFTGHLDCLLKFDNKYYLLDFKTTGNFVFEDRAKATKLGYYPSKKYLAQIETYCMLMKLVYDIDIHKYSIVYMSRDRITTKNKVTAIEPFTYRFTKDKYTKRFHELKRNLRANKVLVNWHLNDVDTIKESISKLYDVRPCENKMQYLNNMKPTLFKEDCRNHVDNTCYNGKVKKKILKQWKGINA